jgi:hypothetical protein
VPELEVPSKSVQDSTQKPATKPSKYFSKIESLEKYSVDKLQTDTVQSN